MQIKNLSLKYFLSNTISTQMSTYTQATYTLCLKKNDTDVAHYNVNAHQPILVIFGRNVAQRVCYRMVICYPTSPNKCLCTTWGNAEMQKLHLFSRMQY